MERTPLFPGTGIVAARSPWLIIAVALALFSQSGIPHPWEAVCGTMALVAAGVVFRRLILFPLVAVTLLAIAIFGNGGEFHRWIHAILRGLIP